MDSRVVPTSSQGNSSIPETMVNDDDDDYDNNDVTETLYIVNIVKLL